MARPGVLGTVAPAAPEGARGGARVGQGLVPRGGRRKGRAPRLQGRAEGAEPRWREGKTGEEASRRGRDGSKARARRTAPRGTAGERRGAEPSRDACASRARVGRSLFRPTRRRPSCGSRGTPSPGRGRRTGCWFGSIGGRAGGLSYGRVERIWNGVSVSLSGGTRRRGTASSFDFRDRESDLLLEVDLPADFSAEPGDLSSREVADYPEGGKEGRARLVRALGKSHTMETLFLAVSSAMDLPVAFPDPVLRGGGGRSRSRSAFPPAAPGCAMGTRRSPGST